jgi:16S rRNA (adenine1518-N6/adenine1519-N6)-dimethyltransferase
MHKYERTRTTLQDRGLAPKKRFGQNFLVHRSTAEAIVRSARVSSRDSVIEVGIGLGALTVPLARSVQHVYGYEIDSGIIRLHEEKGGLPENVTLVHEDILKTDFKKMYRKIGDLIILANLPYSISNPFIFKLIENCEIISRATIMLQREVAERLTASPGTKEYGVPTVLLGGCASVEKLLTLKPSEFHPRPKVDSVVVRIDFNSPRFPLSETEKKPISPLFTRVVRIAFSQRRKTILNTLSSGGFFLQQVDGDRKKNKALTKTVIETAGIEPSVRAERLAVPDYAKLCSEIELKIK